MNFNATTKKIKDTYRNQLDGIVSTIEKFRGDRALTYRPLVKVLGLKLTMCLERSETDNSLSIMFTDENDEYLVDRYGLRITNVFTVLDEDNTKTIFAIVSKHIFNIVEEFML